MTCSTCDLRGRAVGERQQTAVLEIDERRRRDCGRAVVRRAGAARASSGASSIAPCGRPSACAWRKSLLPSAGSLEVEGRRVEDGLDALAQAPEAAAPDEDDAVGRGGLRRRPAARGGAAADVDHREAVALREPLLHEHPQSVGLFAAGGSESRKDLQAIGECRRHAAPVITYVARRVLYSVPVLFVSTFLSFIFVSYAGDPTSNLRQNPQFSAITLAHLRAPVPPRRAGGRPLLVLAAGRLHAQARLVARHVAADLARHPADARAHGAGRVVRGDLRARARHRRRGCYSAVRQYSPFDYFFTTLSFTGSRDAGLLAGAAPADPLRRHLPQVARSDLLHVGAEQHRLGDLVTRSAPAHRAPGDDDLSRQLRALQPLHARCDARRHQLRLRAHRAREGRLAGEGDRPPRRAQCPHPARRRSSRSTSARSSAA